MSRSILRFRALGHRTYSTHANGSVKPFKSIPGLDPLPIIGPLHHFMPVIGSIGPTKNFAEMSDKLYKKFGPMVRLEGMARANLLILYEPEQFEQVYRAEEVIALRPGFDSLVYYREELRKSTFDGVYGLTTAQGPKWRDFRTKVNPALLKPKIVKLYAPALEDIANEVIERFSKVKDDEKYINENLDVEIMKWSLESVALVGLGTRIGCMQDNLSDTHPGRQLMQSSRDIMDLSYKLEFYPSPWKYISTPNFRKIIRTFDKQWEVSEMFIKHAKKKIEDRGHDVPEEDKSIIEKLLAIDEKVAVMMANEMLLAGIETVAFSFTGLLYHLAINQDAQKKLREEILSGDTKRRYFKACLKESLRLKPVLHSNLRRTSQDHIVGGFHVPKGVDVIAPNEYLSKLEKNYPKPDAYLPERWLAEKTDPLYYGNCHPMTTLPFGYGIRTCIGRRIAELELEVLATKFFAKFKVTWTGPPIEVVTKVMNIFVKPYYFKIESWD